MSKASLWSVDWDKVIEERFGVDVETLSKYAEAHKAGMALTVPCKPGDKLYILDADSPEGIEEAKCKKISVVHRSYGGISAKVIVPCDLDDWEGEFREFYPEDFGFKVFDNKDMALFMLSVRKKTNKPSGNVYYRHLHDTLKGEYGNEIEFSGIEQMKSYLVNFFKQSEGFPFREDDIVIEGNGNCSDWYGWKNVHSVGISGLWGIKQNFPSMIGYCTFMEENSTGC